MFWNAAAFSFYMILTKKKKKFLVLGAREHFVINKPAAQAAGQTLPDATPPVGKIHPFSKIAVNFEPIQRFRCPSRFRILI